MNDPKPDTKIDQKGDSKGSSKGDQKTDHKGDQKADQKTDQKHSPRVSPVKNPDYAQIKARAPRILAEMVQMLILWRKRGFNVPRGIKNIFEFTWDELLLTPPRKSFVGLYCPVVKFISMDDTDISSTPVSRAQRLGPTPSRLKPNYVTTSSEEQLMLLKFQKRSVHLLTELLKMKMKLMIEAAAGPSAEEIARKFFESGQKLIPKTREDAAEFTPKEPRRRGRGMAPILPAIPISSTTQLVQQMSMNCLCFQLSLKDTKQQKSGGKEKDPGYDERLDPCPEAKELLREICRTIEDERNAAIAKGHTRPLILRNYMTIHRTPSQALKRASLSLVSSEIRRMKGKKLFISFPDGTSLMYCSIALMMNNEGGSIRDKDGYLTQHWSWYSKSQILQSLEYQINEQLKLKVFNQSSMTITFTDQSESISLSLVRDGCTHRSKTDRQLTGKSKESDNQEGQWVRILIEIKKRFEKIVRQFINGVLMVSGIYCIDYPIDFAPSKQVKFLLKEPVLHAWDRADTKYLDTKRRSIAKPFLTRNLTFDKQFRGKYRSSSRSKAEVSSPKDADRPPEPWAVSLADCPVVLHKIMSKDTEDLCCRCVVKIPLITDLEFEKFIAAPRDPDQVIVIFVLSPQNHSYSPFFEWSIENLYIQMQHGRPSPCIQCKHDPFRFLRYDLESPLNKNPPLLVQKHAVVPGMVVMYAGGKPVFGGCVFNGYSFSKKDLLKQINQVCLDCKMGHFLPQSFKFSPTFEDPKKASVPAVESFYNEPFPLEEPVHEQQKETEKSKRGKKKSKK